MAEIIHTVYKMEDRACFNTTLIFATQREGPVVKSYYY